ncbi:hypothetical protein [Nitrospira sp. BLG_1]|uniref:hypothetical protein n=1 Tax=Nitrospira sp. BLG_1 TaxID=3395883 RepID=UPI0039BC34C4
MSKIWSKSSVDAMEYYVLNGRKQEIGEEGLKMIIASHRALEQRVKELEAEVAMRKSLLVDQCALQRRIDLLCEERDRLREAIVKWIHAGKLSIGAVVRDTDMTHEELLAINKQIMAKQALKEG